MPRWVGPANILGTPFGVSLTYECLYWAVNSFLAALGWASGGGVVWAKRLQKAIASLLSLVMHPVLRSFDEIIFTLNFSLTPPSIHFSFKYACVFTT